MRYIDVQNNLPSCWQQQIIDCANEHSVRHDVRPFDATSREADLSIVIPTLTVTGNVAIKQIPWLLDFYRTVGLEAMNRFYRDEATKEKLIDSSNTTHTINIQRTFPWMGRYECHVDWAPTAILNVTEHAKGKGGALVISNNPEVKGEEEIRKDAVTIYPQAGHLLCFDGRKSPHYVTELTRDNNPDGRVVVVMLYPTGPDGSCPESSRPKELDRHLGHTEAQI